MSAQPMRFATGGRIDRASQVRFEIDGEGLHGLAGDTLASALLANGRHLAGRSFKYHRPRGIFGAGVEEPNALVEVSRGEGRSDPNQRATTVPLYEGLTAETQNRWPSLKHDIGAVNDLMSAFLPAGFYYKTFKWPAGAWYRLYEPVIRKAAGLGRAPTQPDPDSYAQTFAHCDLLIVGAGPTGLAAALAAAPSNQRIIICDLDEELGGCLLASPALAIDGIDSWTWLEQTLAELDQYSNVTILRRTTAFGYGIQNFVTLAERLTDHLPADEAQGARERLWMVRAGKVIIATGAIEQPLMFENNDRPGIMLASAVAKYASRYAVAAGNSVIFCVADDTGYRSALQFADAGGKIRTIVDARSASNSLAAAECDQRGIPILWSTVPVDSRGRLRVSALAVRSDTDAKPRWIDCDAVAVAGGWIPSIHLYSQSGGKPVWSDERSAFLPLAPQQAQQSVGACSGSFGIDVCLAEGWAAGGGDASQEKVCPRLTSPGDTIADDKRIALPQSPARVLSRGNGKAFIDYQNDVTAKDIRLAIQEGFQSVEHIKRYTTNGMATDQGRTSNMNALAIASQTLCRPVNEIGLTTFRSPFTPTTFGTLIGHGRGPLFDPERHTPTHAWALRQGAVFENVGQWKRARYFPKAGEDMAAAVQRECLATRNAAGIFDATTLGKIEVVGPDAAVFMNLMYTNAFSKLGTGNCRYGLMLREDGFIVDDGVIGRISEDCFHVTTSTGGAAGTLVRMEDYRQTEFPHLKVWLTSTTEQWAVFAINGPHARDVIAPLIEGIDMSAEAFPHMSLRHGHVAGVPTRLFRVSFTGELGYEINVPAARAQIVWDALIAAGAPFGLTPYGTETMHVLRAEKGYIIIGQETDGTVTPADAGLDWAVGKKKLDYVGKRSLERPAMLAPDRKQLVGLTMLDGSQVPDEGAQLVDPTDRHRSIGHVTSAYWSANLNRPIALALVRSGHSRMGDNIEVASAIDPIRVQISKPVFYDLENERLNG